MPMSEGTVIDVWARGSKGYAIVRIPAT
jgi:hypothetical protein